MSITIIAPAPLRIKYTHRTFTSYQEVASSLPFNTPVVVTKGEIRSRMLRVSQTRFYVEGARSSHTHTLTEIYQFLQRRMEENL